MNLSEYVIPVPGRFDGAAAFVDLETRKVPCDYVMANGERLRHRWSVILAGVAIGGQIRLMNAEDERDLLAALGWAVDGCEVVYAGTREFDEMILRGRFTNARRAHAAEPFFPAMPGAADLAWYNARHEAKALTEERGEDIPSRDVPAAWADGSGYEMVMIHLLRDVAELILAAGNPDAECRDWCRLVLADRVAALDAVFGGE